MKGFIALHKTNYTISPRFLSYQSLPFPHPSMHVVSFYSWWNMSSRIRPKNGNKIPTLRGEEGRMEIVVVFTCCPSVFGHGCRSVWDVLAAYTCKRSIISKQLLAYDWSGRIKAFHAVEIIRNRVYFQNRRLPSGIAIIKMFRLFCFTVCLLVFSESLVIILTIATALWNGL